MNNITILITKVKELKDQISVYDADLASKCDSIIQELESLKKSFETDQIIDRAKKISEIINPILKYLIAFFTGHDFP